MQLAREEEAVLEVLRNRLKADISDGNDVL